MPSVLLKPSKNVFNDCFKVVLLLWILFIIYVHVCYYYTVLSVPCSLVITWEKADRLDFLWMMFACVFVTFTYGVSGIGIDS